MIDRDDEIFIVESRPRNVSEAVDTVDMRERVPKIVEENFVVVGQAPFARGAYKVKFTSESSPRSSIQVELSLGKKFRSLHPP